MLHLSDLQVTFSPGTPLEKLVFRDFSLTIPPGQFVTVIGSNGAGKSTLLNVLSGEVNTSSGLQAGQVMIAERNVTSWSVARRAKLVSRVFQNPLAGSCAELSLEENLLLAQRRSQSLSLRPALTKPLRRQFRERLATLNLGLEDRLGDKMGLLSGGQRQAVSLLMATLAPTKVLLLDEHTAALDPTTAAYILDLTRELVIGKQLTTLMVTHSMQQALDLGDRTLMLHDGRIVLDISGSDRVGLSVNDLLDAFARQNSMRSDTDVDMRAGVDAIADDSLLLS
ncbi:MAG: ATP-binding cassette domain-containing protein [Cyanobacteria bacterium J06623_5]